jgi:hypothetical protein
MNTPITDKAFSSVIAVVGSALRGGSRADAAVGIHFARKECRKLEVELNALKEEREWWRASGVCRTLSEKLEAAEKRIADLESEKSMEDIGPRDFR